MFQTNKLTLAAALSLSALTLPAVAEAQDANRGEIIAALIKKASAEQTGTATGLRADIEGRIQELLTQMEGSGDATTPSAVTIDEIDRINRSAEHERTALEFEKTRFERMQLELDRMLALYEAAKILETDAKAQASAERAKIDAAAKTAEPKKPDPSVGERADLPRIVSISGVGGSFSAEAEFEGQVPTTIRVGDEIDAGFIVSDIRSTHVMLEGPGTGNLYRVTPRAEREMETNDQAPGVGSVIDLSQFPMAQF